MRKLTTELIYEIIDNSNVPNVIYIAGEHEILHFRDLYMKNGRFDLLDVAVCRLHELEISHSGIAPKHCRVFLVDDEKNVKEISFSELMDLFSKNEKHPYI